MAPIDLVGGEWRLLIHLKAERLMDVICGGDRQSHGLGENIGLPQAKHKAVARGPRQLFQQVCRNPEMAERGFPAVAPEIDPNTVNLTRQRTHRADHQRVLADRSEPNPACGKKIRKLADPPREEIPKHPSRPTIRSQVSMSAAPILRRISVIRNGLESDQVVGTLRWRCGTECPARPAASGRDTSSPRPRRSRARFRRSAPPGAICGAFVSAPV